MPDKNKKGNFSSLLLTLREIRRFLKAPINDHIIITVLVIFSLYIPDADGANCSLGSVAVSNQHSPFSCRNSYNGPKITAHAESNEDCPNGTESIVIAGRETACQKTIDSRPELVLRLGETCPTGYRRFVDSDGADACRPSAQNISGTTTICTNGLPPLVVSGGQEICQQTAGGAPRSGALSQSGCPLGSDLGEDSAGNPACIEH